MMLFEQDKTEKRLPPEKTTREIKIKGKRGNFRNIFSN